MRILEPDNHFVRVGKLQAQDINRYMVYFADKANNTYSLEEPEVFYLREHLKEELHRQLP